WNGLSCSSTNSENQPWWQEDLGSSRAIANVTVYGRTDCCPEMSNNFYVLVSTSPIQSTTLSAALSEAGVWHSAVSSPGTISVGQTGRYVRIWKSDQTWLVLAEVLVQ
ncbi:MAG TPA: discoidin domain-containing protein, partial [Candidatus Dormibacteraeota bacterium]|nr:discoidin domain-containing protein [Candidatus Dormibacteraeota bacterium]